jgi:hypothetical protein
MHEIFEKYFWSEKEILGEESQAFNDLHFVQ